MWYTNHAEDVTVLKRYRGCAAFQNEVRTFYELVHRSAPKMFRLCPLSPCHRCLQWRRSYC